MFGRRRERFTIHSCFLSSILISFLLFVLVLTSLSCSNGGNSARISQELTTIVENIMNDYLVPGAVVGVWCEGREVFLRAFGKADAETGLDMDREQLWKVASITKTFTAVVVLQLVEEGLVHLDDRLDSFAFSEGLANADQITVRNLLNHTSGYSDLENDNPAFQEIRFGNPTRVWTHEEILEWGRAIEPLFSPGDYYYYTNFAYYLLGMIIEEVTGRSAAEEIQTRCADELGLTETALDDMADFLLSRPHASGYVSRNDLPPGITVPGDDDPVDATTWNTTAGWTSAGVVSSVRELKTWISAIADGRLLSPAMCAEQWTTVPMTDQEGGPRYGLGIAILETEQGPFFWHNGATLGYSAFAGSLENEGLSIVVLMNMMPAGQQNCTVATETATAILEVMLENMFP